MVECGIKKYDEIPSRVGVIDVDYLRFKLESVTKRQNKLEREMNKIVEKLNEARKKWKEEQKK